MTKSAGNIISIIVLLLIPFASFAGQADSGTGESVPPEEPKVEETFVTPEEAESLGIPVPNSNQPATTTQTETAGEGVPVSSNEPTPTVPTTPTEADVLLVETETVEPTSVPEPSNTLFYVFAGLGALIAFIGAGYVSMQSRKSTNEELGRCAVEKQALDASEAELSALRAELNVHETALSALKDKGADVAKDKLDDVMKKIRESLEKRNGLRAKAGKALGVTETGVNKLLDAKDAYETATELIENLKILLSAKQAETSTERALYEACMGATAKSIMGGAEAIIPTFRSEKVILVDAMGAFVYEGEGIYEPLHKLLETYPNRKIVLTMAPDDLMEKWGLNHLPYEVYTSKRDPMKANPQYFSDVLKHFNLKKESVIYFEHAPEAVESAKSLGITSYWYDGEKKDLDALKKFLDSNL